LTRLLQKQKAIVTPEWLRESIKLKFPAPCGDFAAIKQLHNDTIEHCPERDERSERLQSTAHSLASAAVIKPTSEKVKNNWRSRYACARAHPSVCPNQALAIALDVLGRSRELEGLSVNALAYERAVAVSV
jgi:DNA polymerase mu